MTSIAATLLIAIIAVVSAAAIAPRSHGLRRSSKIQNGAIVTTLQSHARLLGSLSICGTNWTDASSSCVDACESDESCGPGRFCFHYMECTPPEIVLEEGDDGGVSEEDMPALPPSDVLAAMGISMEDITAAGNDEEPAGLVNGADPATQHLINEGDDQANEEVTSTTKPPAPYASMEMMSSQSYPSSSSSSSSSSSNPPVAAPSIMDEISASNYMPAYIASLPLAPDQPTTNAPFTIPVPTPNTLSNPNGNYCGYGYESANAECFHACPSGLDSECPGGRTCHTWLKCTPPTVDPSLFNVCGTSWAHASTTCATRCYLGDDDTCPDGQTCFGGVKECEGHESLPALTAIDVGAANKTYTKDEIAILLDEEIEKERAEEAMADPNNWWCGTTWSNMLETCASRCTTDEDCKLTNPSQSWSPDGTCFKTPGGKENCVEVGVPVKEAVPEGSRWCGLTWNDMLETCAAQCEEDTDCANGGKCWEAPNTCQYIGVPVKEVSDPATLWCGVDFDDAMTSCHKPCPGESDDECDSGMSCFAGSECVEEGTPVIREGYRCGVTWDDAALNCGKECQKTDDCNTDEGQECFAEVVCEKDKETEAGGGMYCGVTWESTSLDCAKSCEVDEECDNGEWCYWVECEAADDANLITDDDATEDDDDAMQEPDEEEIPVSCNAEVKECKNGDFVGRAPELDCDFYPCPEDDVEGGEAAIDDDESTTADEVMMMSEEATSGESSSGGESPASSSEPASGSDSESNKDIMAGWGSTPLTHVCTSDGAGGCGLCQGDCNSDADCLEGLLCFSRGAGEMTSVPGCVSGGEDDKPGMDYCYTPFEPETTEPPPMEMSAQTEDGDDGDDEDMDDDEDNGDVDDDDANTDTEETIEAEEDEASSGNAWVDDEDDEENDDEEETVDAVELNYERECTEDEPCGVCEGDCDDDSHCADGLTCFMRGDGNVDLVPGCSGLGIAGMDYCYDPTASDDLPPINEDDEVQVGGGCSAEVLFCPGGHVVKRDPNNKCEFESCPTSASSMVASAAVSESDDIVPTVMPAMAVPISDAASETPSPTVGTLKSTDSFTYYCGYTLDEVNNNCELATPCPQGRDDECTGMEICIHGTSCGGTISATNVTAATTVMDEMALCEELCLEALPSDFCPEDPVLPNCLEVDVGQVCEATGECGTDDKLNNCGTYDVYARVVCGFATPSQAELMRSSTAPSPSVSSLTTTTNQSLSVSSVPATPVQSQLPVTKSPTQTPAAMVMISSTNETIITTVSSIADVIANATANATTTTISLPPQGPSSSPIQAYENNIAIQYTFDRNQGTVTSGGADVADLATQTDGASWYDSNNDGDVGDADEGDWGTTSEVSDGGWNFESTYFDATKSSGMLRRINGVLLMTFGSIVRMLFINI